MTREAAVAGDARGLPIESLLDRDFLPDWVIRAGIRRIVAARLREQEAGGIRRAVGPLRSPAAGARRFCRRRQA